MARTALSVLLVGAVSWCAASRSLFQDSNHGCVPRQVHLALTEDSSEMRVQWTTKHPGCSGSVRYWRQGRGTESGNAVQQQLGLDSSYSAADMCSAPARDYRFDPPNLHSVVLTGLEQGERYEYQLEGSSDVQGFRAALAPGDGRSYKFVVYADMGESDHAAAKSPGAADTAAWATREVQERGADMVLHVGDIAYANGNEKIWTTFMQYIEPYASRAPYMVACGNHEVGWKGKTKADPSGAGRPYDPDWGNYGNDSGGECGVPLAARFVMPSAGSNEANAPFWYSFEYGSVHFTIISTEHDLTPDSAQHKWLKHDLRQVDRCRCPWLIVGMHRPMYVPHPHKSNRIVGEHLRGSLEDLFSRRGVDMVFSGHVHSYGRTCAVYDERCMPADGGGSSWGITHVTLGCGGHRLSDVAHAQLDWLEAAEMRFGYGTVVVDDEQLSFEYVTTEDGHARDGIVLQRQRHLCVAGPNNITLEVSTA